LDENRQVQARYALERPGANGFRTTRPSAIGGLQTVNNPTPRTLAPPAGAALPDGAIGPVPGVSIEDTMAAISYNDSIPGSGTNNAAEIKTVLDKKIDTLTMEINSKAQKIGGFNGTRQAFTQAFTAFGQGIGGAVQGNYQKDMGQDDMESAIQTQINQQATSMVQTDQGQISNTFNLVGQTLSTLGQISTSANQ
jgi:hypothetical protein